MFWSTVTVSSLLACSSSNSQFITSLHFFVCVFIKAFWGLPAEGIYLVIYFSGSMRIFPRNITPVIGLVANAIITVHHFSPCRNPDWCFQNVNLILDISGYTRDISKFPWTPALAAAFALLMGEALPAALTAPQCSAAKRKEGGL